MMALRWVTRSHLSPLFHFFGSGSSAVFFPYHQGNTLLGELEGGIAYGDVELATLSPGFYCHLFIDSFGFKVLATIVGLVGSLRVCSSDLFRMESHHSVHAVQRFAWMISIDL